MERVDLWNPPRTANTGDRGTAPTRFTPNARFPESGVVLRAVGGVPYRLGGWRYRGVLLVPVGEFADLLTEVQ